MRLISRRPRAAPPGTLGGPAKLDRRTRRLAGRLAPGDVAVIDHIDLDRGAAAALVAAGAVAVLNARPSVSGRYPNLGPELLVEAGVALVDDLGEDLFQHLRDGTHVVVDGGAVLVDGVAVAYGDRQDAQSVLAAMLQARQGLTVHLEAFAADTGEYLSQERDLLLEGIGMPQLRTRVSGRHCLVVSRGHGDRSELAALRAYVHRFRPVLIGVDGGADVLLDAGHRPDIIVGDLDCVTDSALRGGAEVVIHVDPDGRGAGPARAVHLNIASVLFPAAASSEELAILLAEAHGAALIVTAGSHATLTEFMDRGRAGMAPAFLARLKVGGRLVDAQAVGRLVGPEPSAGAVALAVACALTAALGAVSAATLGHPVLDTLLRWWDRLLVGLS